MGISPFKPAHRDKSNGGIPILLRPLDAELIGKMSSNWRFSTFDTTPFDVSSNISVSSGRRRMGIPPFEPARRDESNGGIPILLQPQDAELIGKMPSFLSLSVLRHLMFHHRRLRMPPFNRSRWASSNGGIFVLLRPLDAKIDLNGIWDGIWDWDGNGIWDLGFGIWDLGFRVGWDSKWVASIPITKMIQAW